MNLKHFFLPLVMLLAAGCAEKAGNVLHGTVSGLQPGDRVYLLVENFGGTAWSPWLPVDSTVVDTPGEFTLHTSVTDQGFQLALVPAGAPVELNNTTRYLFLEGYDRLTFKGNVNNWRYLSVYGGIYAHPALKEKFALENEALTLQAEGFALSRQASEEGDEQKTANARQKLDRSSALFGKTRPLIQRFIDGYPDAAYSAELMRYDDDDFDRYIERYEKFTPPCTKYPHRKSHYFSYR